MGVSMMMCVCVCVGDDVCVSLFLSVSLSLCLSFAVSLSLSLAISRSLVSLSVPLFLVVRAALHARHTHALTPSLPQPHSLTYTSCLTLTLALYISRVRALVHFRAVSLSRARVLSFYIPQKNTFCYCVRTFSHVHTCAYTHTRHMPLSGTHTHMHSHFHTHTPTHIQRICIHIFAHTHTYTIGCRHSGTFEGN